MQFSIICSLRCSVGFTAKLRIETQESSDSDQYVQQRHQHHCLIGKPKGKKAFRAKSRRVSIRGTLLKNRLKAQSNLSELNTNFSRDYFKRALLKAISNKYICMFISSTLPNIAGSVKCIKKCVMLCQVYINCSRTVKLNSEVFTSGEYALGIKQLKHQIKLLLFLTVASVGIR